MALPQKKKMCETFFPNPEFLTVYFLFINIFTSHILLSYIVKILWFYILKQISESNRISYKLGKRSILFRASYLLMYWSFQNFPPRKITFFYTLLKQSLVDPKFTFSFSHIVDRSVLSQSIIAKDNITDFVNIMPSSIEMFHINRSNDIIKFPQFNIRI